MSRHFAPALFAVALLGAAQPLAAADALSASYWDAAYAATEADDGTVSEDLEGFRLAASVGLFKVANLIADYEQRRYDSDLREGFGSAGVALHNDHPVWQVHGALTYERLVYGSGPDEEGYGVEVGGRYALGDVVLHAAWRYLDFGTERGTETDFTGSRFNVGVDAQLCPWWSLVADYRGREHTFEDRGASASVDYTGFTVGFRRYFATDPDRKQRKGGLLSGLFSGDAAAE